MPALRENLTGRVLRFFRFRTPCRDRGRPRVRLSLGGGFLGTTVLLDCDFMTILDIGLLFGATLHVLL